MSTQTLVAVMMPFRATQELRACANAHEKKLAERQKAEGGFGEMWAARHLLADVGDERNLCGFNNADRGLLSWSAGIRNGDAAKFIEYIRPFVDDALSAGGDDMPPASARVIVLEQREGRGILAHQLGPAGDREVISAVEASWERE